MMIGRLDLYVRQDNRLHRLDPRAKLAAVAGFLAGAMFAPVRPPWALLGLVALLGAATVVARVPLRIMARRLVAVGIVVGFPLALSRLGGEMTRLAGESLAAKSLLVAASFLVLAATSKPWELLEAVSRAPLLAGFAALAQFILRGVDILAAEVTRSNLAAALRAPRASMRVRLGGLIAVSISLLGRAAARSERQGAAMALRGFDGHFPPAPARALPVYDLLWGAAFGLASLTIGVAARWI